MEGERLLIKVEQEEGRTGGRSNRRKVEQEDDGRWIAEVRSLPGVMVYGESRENALARAAALALRVLADRLEHGEAVPELSGLFGAA
jgi:predicted RNase H-like HicB family nuclease